MANGVVLTVGTSPSTTSLSVDTSEGRFTVVPRNAATKWLGVAMRGEQPLCPSCGGLCWTDGARAACNYCGGAGVINHPPLPPPERFVTRRRPTEREDRQ